MAIIRAPASSSCNFIPPAPCIILSSSFISLFVYKLNTYEIQTFTMIAFLVDLRQGNKKKESRISNFFCSFACMTVFLVCAICYTIFATRVHVLKGYKRALGTVKSSYISVSGSNSQRYETSWYCSLYFNKKWDLIRRNNYKFLQ